MFLLAAPRRHVKNVRALVLTHAHTCGCTLYKCKKCTNANARTHRIRLPRTTTFGHVQLVTMHMFIAHMFPTHTQARFLAHTHKMCEYTHVHILEQEDDRRREPILNVQDLIQAVLADIESDPTCLHTLKNSFKRLLQTHRTRPPLSPQRFRENDFVFNPLSP